MVLCAGMGSSLPIEEAICSTSGQGAAPANRAFTGSRPDLDRYRHSSRSSHKQYRLLARSDARSQDFQRGGLDFQRAAKLRVDQLVNCVQGYVCSCTTHSFFGHL